MEKEIIEASILIKATEEMWTGFELVRAEEVEHISWNNCKNLALDQHLGKVFKTDRASFTSSLWPICVPFSRRLLSREIGKIKKKIIIDYIESLLPDKISFKRRCRW